jgi:hypothetical protein
MLRVPFNSQVQPPAPFLLVTLSDPLDGRSTPDLPAQLDTAADRTVVPLAVVKSLGLEPVDELEVVGLGGVRQTVPVYVVGLAIRSLPPRPVRVIAHADEPWVLLGRDVLNDYRLLLDGPNLVLELG